MKKNKITNFIIRNPYWSTLFFPFVPIIILILLFIYTDSTNPYGLVTTTTATPNPFLHIISNIWSITAPYIFLFAILGWIIYCIVVVGKEKRVKLIVLFFSICFLAFLLFFLYTFWIHSINHPPRAKTVTTKIIHAQTIEYISAEIQGCALGEITAMDGNLTCSKLNAANVAAAAAKTLTDKNPYSTKNNAVRISASNTKDEDVGYVNLSASGSDVVVKSCHKKPCSNENNRRSDTIEIK